MLSLLSGIDPAAVVRLQLAEVRHKVLASMDELEGAIIKTSLKAAQESEGGKDAAKLDPQNNTSSETEKQGKTVSDSPQGTTRLLCSGSRVRASTCTPVAVLTFLHGFVLSCFPGVKQGQPSAIMELTEQEKNAKEKMDHLMRV